MHDGHGEREAALTELREKLTDALARAGLTKTQLAARSGLGRTTVQDVFRADATVPSAATIAALARVLPLPDAELLNLRRIAAGQTGPVLAEVLGPGKPIGEWNPHDLEVHPAGTASGGKRQVAVPEPVLPGYVPRGHDRVLATSVAEAAQGHSRMLVLVGTSSTGKTRACWEAVQPLAAQGWRLWHPFDPSRAEAALDELERVAPRTVVWLNEAQHYIGNADVGEQVAAALHTLLTHPDRRPVLVLGTLWPEYADQYTALPRPSAADPHSRVRELLAGRTFTVPDTFAPEDLRAATDLAQNGDLLLADTLTRARSHGRITQDLAGAPELLRRYEQSTPAAKAVLEAAMDARRLGTGLHLPQTFLTDAAIDYLSDHDYDELAEDWAEAAFAELARPVHGKQAPLRRTNTRPQRHPPGVPARATGPIPVTGAVFRLADYLEQHGRNARRALCPPGSFWDAAHTHLTHPNDLYTLAIEACYRWRLQWAYHLACRAADAGMPQALTRLARTKQERGDGKGTEALARQAADSGDTSALLIPARMKEEIGDIEAAEALYRQVADTGNPDALVELARIRGRAGDYEAAESLYCQVADTGNPDALVELARIRERAGDHEAAKSLYRQAADGGSPRALVQLARIREYAGDHEAAETLALQAAHTGGTEALVALARIREYAGDRKAARILALQAADFGDADALIELSRIRERAGDHEAAETLALQAAHTGNDTALLEIVLMRKEAGDGEAAKTLNRQVAEAGDPIALVELALVWKEAGDGEAAETLIRQAAETGDPIALVQLALMRTEAGDGEAAETLIRQAAEAGDSFALFELARIRERAGDHEAAETLALQAAHTGITEALVALALMREEAGDREGVETLYRRAADTGRLFSPHDERWPYGLDPDGTPTLPWSLAGGIAWHRPA
ncbi:helix-turn-helix domain-containing protein [Streptomyces sp. NPDC059101]|uniref:helix-turn-helix domain-containing protein n=1 Tax=Streptomyces sp. NPDC059101 TaxID=3346728 RepID=UPI00367BE0C0